MDGKIINVMEFTDFSLGLLGVGFVDIWVAQNIPLVPFTAGRMAVSFRSVNLANAGSSVRFDLIPVVLRWDDPGKFYRDTNKPLPSTGVVQAGVINSTGVLKNQELALLNGEPLPSMASLRMRVTQGAAASTIDFTVAVDLQLKTC